MKNVLILGVNGFIGHHLSTRILNTTDWRVFGMDMYSDRIAPLLENSRLKFFEGDITINREWIEYHVKKIARRRNMWWYRAEAKVDGNLIAEAEVGAVIAEA